MNEKTSINAINPNLWVPTEVYYRVWLSCSNVSTR